MKTKDHLTSPLPGQRKTTTGDAGLLRRLLAIALDILIIDITLIAPFAALIEQNMPGTFSEQLAALQNGLPSELLFIFAFISILSFLYFTLFQYYFTQTLGMRILKIKVTGNITLFSSAVRSIMALPFFPFYLFWIIEPIHIAYRKIGFLEQITKTQTIIEP